MLKSCVHEFLYFTMLMRSQLDSNDALVSLDTP